MKRQVTTIRYRNRELNLIEFIGQDFVEMSDVKASLLGRSRRSILEFCQKNSIPIIIIKDGNKIIAELINYPLFQQLLSEQSTQITTTIKPKQKKLPGMQSSLFFYKTRRCIDFLRGNSFDTYVNKHLNGPQLTYRAFGLLITASSYREFNLQANEKYADFDLFNMASRDTILANLDERIENLVDFLNKQRNENETFLEFVTRVLNDKKLTANEQFLTLEEIVNNELINQYFD